MSLILEALKKLEREKQTQDRGFLVVAHVPWAAGPPGRSRWLGLAVALTTLGFLVTLLLLRGREGRPAAATAVSSPPPMAPPASAPVAPPETLPSRSSPRVATTPPPPVPAVSPSPAGEVELRLNAITQQGGRPIAVLNDRLVREGDVFDGIQVIRIGETEVEVEVHGKRRIVRF